MSSDLNRLRIDRSMKTAPAPQANSRGWGVVVLAIILALAAGTVFALKRGPAPVDVQVTTVQAPASPSAGQAASVSSDKGDDEVVLSATGYIVAAHKIALAPKVVGRVRWVGVEMGDHVETGQELVRLEDDEFKARVAQARGQLNAAKAKLAELEGGSRQEEVARSQAEYEQAVADMDNAKSNLDRSRKLAGTNVLSEQAIDDAEARYKLQKARADAAKAALDLVKAGPRREQIDAARAQVEQAAGNLALVQIDLDNTIIRAPLSGTILARNVEVGEYVTTGFVGEGGAKGYVVSIADLTDLRVELDISQSDFQKVSLGQSCTVTTDAYPDRRYRGVVDQISPEANRQKATILTKVKVLDPDELLRPDMNASVSFHPAKGAAGTSPAQSSTRPAASGTSVRSTANAAAAGFVIPTAALRGSTVFVVRDGRAVKREVKVGAKSARGVYVTGDIVAGDTLVVNPPQELIDGQRVRVSGQET